MTVNRFGRGQDIYLTVWGPASLPATVDVDIEAAALGLSPNPVFTEMIASTPLTVVPSARGWKVTVPMELYMTRVIKIHSLSSGVTLYPLTVNSGSGSGFYTNGQQVAITASNLAGQTFVQWIGDTQYVNNVTAPNATVTMPTNPVTLTATYVGSGPAPIAVVDSTGGNQLPTAA